LLSVAKLLEGAGAIGIKIELAIGLESLSNPNAIMIPTLIIKILVNIHAHMKYFNACHM
jgi:hypothetical protein